MQNFPTLLLSFLIRPGTQTVRTSKNFVYNNSIFAHFFYAFDSSYLILNTKPAGFRNGIDSTLEIK